MSVSVTSSSRRRQWHIDRVNGAPSPAQQFQCAVDFARGELTKCQATRPEDAAGLYRQLAHFIATFAADVHRSHPAPGFEDSFPALPGGGWASKPRSDARLP